ncbi:hypothetical protein [Streptomyces sp. NPDC042319]|uniref:hypothetical protein n=1 Tax=Streptomyces sp. NPDC042319 TaxID=3154332 RepID=UPI0033DE0AE4
MAEDALHHRTSLHTDAPPAPRALMHHQYRLHHQHSVPVPHDHSITRNGNRKETPR